MSLLLPMKVVVVAVVVAVLAAVPPSGGGAEPEEAEPPPHPESATRNTRAIALAANDERCRFILSIPMSYQYLQTTAHFLGDADKSDGKPTQRKDMYDKAEQCDKRFFVSFSYKPGNQVTGLRMPKVRL